MKGYESANMLTVIQKVVLHATETDNGGTFAKSKRPHRSPLRRSGPNVNVHDERVDWHFSHRANETHDIFDQQTIHPRAIGCHDHEDPEFTLQDLSVK